MPSARAARGRCRRAPRVLLAVLATLASCLAWAQTSPEPPLPAYPLERLVPGTLGYGLTEGPGGSIERFEVEVVALQRGLGPAGLSLVLIQTRGAVIDAGGGVAAGMSGSPVYLDLDGERALLGAVGYVFPDTSGALALVTPIDAMREQTAAASRGAVELPTGVVPVATPLLVAGLGGRALGLLDELVLPRAALPFVSVQGGGAAARPSASGESAALQPGSAIGIALVRGDVDIAAIGTVTETDGDRVLALGHPFFGTGSSGWLLSAATVNAIVPSRVVPFKLAELDDRVVGTVTEDRPAGVAARLGTSSSTIDVSVLVDVHGTRQTLHFEVVADETLWPGLVAVATLEALDRVWQRTSSGSARLAWELSLDGGPPLRMLDEISHGSDVTLAAARLAGAPLAVLARNPFERPLPTALQLLIELEDRRRDAELVEALVERGPVRAGESVGLFLRLQPWRRQSEVRTLTVRLPETLPSDATLVVRGAAEPRDDEHEGGVDGLILSYAELLTVLREHSRSGDLVVEVRGVDGRWEVLERLSLPYLVRGVERIELDLEADDEPQE